MADEKPLEKSTVKELKEIALALGTIQGVSAMKKQELIDAIKDAKGIPIKKERNSSVLKIFDVKNEIRSLKTALAEVREKGDTAQKDRVRKKISMLKKKTRRMARQAVVTM